jgi:hypothetical protein
MKKRGKPRGVKGRNPTGLRAGELVSEYPQTTLRLPPDVSALLKRIAAKEDHRPQWRVMVDAIRAYAASLGVQ